MNWDSLYGGGNTGFEPSDSLQFTDVVLSDSRSMSFSDTQSGTSPLPWSASVAIMLEQEFAVTGSLNNFATISGSLVSNNSTSTSGIGTAGIFSVVPGNLLELIFEVGNSMEYELAGNILFTGNSSRSSVNLSRFNGSSFSTLYTSNSAINGTSGTFFNSGTLTSGIYRLRMQGEVPGVANAAFTSQADFQFSNLSAVPEPATMSLLALGGILALYRRKRK